ncbi:UNVERIFIED_ORG: hypothetical protein ABRZ91_000902 [Heyndrickxia coagulans]
MYCKQKIKNKNGLPVTECSFARDEKEKNGPGADQTVFYNDPKRQKRSSFPANCPLQRFKKTKALQLSSELSFTTVQKDKSVPASHRTVFYSGPKRQKRSSFPANCLLQRFKKTKAYQLPPELSFTPAQKDKTVPAFH